MPRPRARSMMVPRLASRSRGEQAAQAVVRAERHDQDLDPAFKGPVEATESAGRRVTRHPGVYDLMRQTGVPHAFLEKCGVCLGRRDAEPCGQAVAEEDDPWRRVLSRGRGDVGRRCAG